MQVIHIAVVDDEEIQLNFMQSLVEQAANKLNFKPVISRFSSGEAFLFALEDLPELDIVLLDIQMKAIDGMEVAQKIREQDDILSLVFVTAYAEYAMEGYAVSALDFILKPVSLDKVIHVFARFLKQQPEQTDYLIVEHQGQLMRLNLADILYIEARKHQSIVNWGKERLTINLNLSHIEQDLNDTFIAPHRSFLVNLRHVELLLKQDLQLSNGEKIPLSRRSVKKVQNAFIEYYKKEVFYE